MQAADIIIANARILTMDRLCPARKRWSRRQPHRRRRQQ
jgi:hypothetical protein